MGKPLVAHVKIKKVNAVTITDTDDLVAAEEPLEIRLGYGQANDRAQKSISVTMRTPGNDHELALGFLYTEGIIKDKGDILTIKYCTEAHTIENLENIIRIELKENVTIDFQKLQRNFYTTSSCGVCGKASIDAVRNECCLSVSNSPLFISKDVIISLPGKLRSNQNIFTYTGGLHAAALFNTEGNLSLVREDVGRHNALDKLTGAALNAGMLPLENQILLLSGRASFELIQKAVMAGIKIVCAVGAPSSLALQMAKEFNITLIGFLRDKRFNIYTGAERIII